MRDDSETRKKFFEYYKHYVETVEKRDLDYSFNNWLSINERDYQIYSPKAFLYAMTKIKEGVGTCR